MGETTLRELVYGKRAHVDPVACVEDISAELAIRTVPSYPHSIWQIVGHMNYWMDYDLRTIAGEHLAYPDHASDSWPAHPDPASEDQWQAVTQRFSGLLGLLARMADSDASTLERIVNYDGPSRTARQSTVHALLWLIAAHNSYHTGQLALLRRQLGAWPPRRGGDTW